MAKEGSQSLELALIILMEKIHGEKPTLRIRTYCHNPGGESTFSLHHPSRNSVFVTALDRHGQGSKQDKRHVAMVESEHLNMKHGCMLRTGCLLGLENGRKWTECAAIITFCRYSEVLIPNLAPKCRKGQNVGIAFAREKQ